MLDTVLDIGRTFRQSPTGLRHHVFIKMCPDPKEDDLLIVSIPILDNFSPDLEQLKIITNEYEIKKLFYLTHKTANSDGIVKYIFGDIFYTISKDAESGYYRLGNPSNKQKAYQVSSFHRGEEDFRKLEMLYANKFGKEAEDSFMVTLFRKGFREHIAEIENILKYPGAINEYLRDYQQSKPDIQTLLKDEILLMELQAKNSFSKASKKNLKDLFGKPDVSWGEICRKKENIKLLNSAFSGRIFLHFDFEGKHWYEFTDELTLLNEKMLDDFVESDNNGYIIKKSLYKTLSGTPSEDMQFPDFSASGRHKNKVFNNIEQASDLFYAIDYSKTGLISIKFSGIKIVVLPRGNNLTAEDFEKFIENKSDISNEQTKEEIISQANQIEECPVDRLFAPIVDNGNDRLVQFDIIFSKRGGMTSPDVDMIELSGIQKSHLNYISSRIQSIGRNIFDQRMKDLKVNNLYPFSIESSFINILGDVTKDKKKYQNHIVKVLPQIYTGSYYYDPVLLPAFIEKAGYNIRNGKPDYNFLKYDYYFLTNIQNTLIEGETLMKILQSQSYQTGILLGRLAHSFAGRETPIKSFEKNYVGNLTRRISTLSDVIEFKTFLEEKLVIHDKNYENIRNTSLELADRIKNFEGKYDKNECAFGFFESYFAPFKSKQDESATVSNL